MGTIVAIGFRVLSLLGVKDALAKKLAPLGFALALAVAIPSLYGVVKLAVWLHDRNVIAQNDAKREAKSSKAREQSADEGATDAVRNAKNEEDLHHAIDTAPSGGALDPAARALACERLRKLGRVPEACRPAGGDGVQAGTE